MGNYSCVLVLMACLGGIEAIRREIDPEDRPASIVEQKSASLVTPEWTACLYVVLYAMLVVIAQSSWPMLRDRVSFEPSLRSTYSHCCSHSSSWQVTRNEIASRKVQIFAAKKAAGDHNNPDTIVQCFKYEREALKLEKEVEVLGTN